MSQQIATRGKTKISIQTEGCHGCGTRWSSGWSTKEVFNVIVGKRTIDLSIPICVDCQPLESKSFQVPLTVLGDS